MTTPRVSVVLPVFNAESYIQRAIQSIVDQTFSNWELIVVDDGSTDRTPFLIKEFDDSRIRYHGIEHSGVAVAANFGMNNCNGEYVARMDSDDFSFPERIEKQVAYLDRNDSIGVASSLVKHGGDSQRQGGYAHHIDWINSLKSHEALCLNRFVDLPIANPSVMFRKNLLEQHGMHKEGPIPEDYELWLRWMDQGVKFGKVDEVLFEWSDYDSRLTRNHKHYEDSRFQEVKAEYFSKWYYLQGMDKPIWIWGNGTTVRRKSAHLTKQGLSIAGFIDMNLRNQADVIQFEEVADLKDPLILNYVADRKGRVQIQVWLESHGFICGHDYWMMA